MFEDLENAFAFDGINCHLCDTVASIFEHNIGEFVSHHLVSYFLRYNYSINLVCLADTVGHHASIQQKLSSKFKEAASGGKLRTFELSKHYTQLLDGSLTSLPVSAEVAAVAQMLGCPTESQLRPAPSLSGITGIVKQMIDNSLKTSERCLVAFDDLSVLLSLNVPIKDVLNCVWDLATYCQGKPITLLLGSSMEEYTTLDKQALHPELYSVLNNFLRHNSTVVCTTEGLSTGYSPNIHGKLSVTVSECTGFIKPDKKRQLHYKLTDRSVSLFAVGTAAGVL